MSDVMHVMWEVKRTEQIDYSTSCYSVQVARVKEQRCIN